MPLDVSIREAAYAHAEAFDLEPRLLLALITVESAGRPWALRYEPRYRWLYEPARLARAERVSLDTERMQQQVSWGVCQVMGAVARERGHQGYLSQLCDPWVGIEYGCRQLVWLRERFGDQPEALAAAYNAGRPRRGADGRFVNQGYVDKVRAALARLEA